MVRERFGNSELMNRISLCGNWNSKHFMQGFWLPEGQSKELQKSTTPIKAMKILAKIVKNLFFPRTLEISPRLITIQGVFIPKKNLHGKQGALWCFKLSYSHPPLPSRTSNLENQQLWFTITTKASKLATIGGSRMDLCFPKASSHYLIYMAVPRKPSLPRLIFIWSDSEFIQWKQLFPLGVLVKNNQQHLFNIMTIQLRQK